jgi:hypothetical protein
MEPLPRNGPGISAHLTVIAYQLFYMLQFVKSYILVHQAWEGCLILLVRCHHGSKHWGLLSFQELCRKYLYPCTLLACQKVTKISENAAAVDKHR